MIYVPCTRTIYNKQTDTKGSKTSNCIINAMNPSPKQETYTDQKELISSSAQNTKERKEKKPLTIAITL